MGRCALHAMLSPQEVFFQDPWTSFYANLACSSSSSFLFFPPLRRSFHNTSSQFVFSPSRGTIHLTFCKMVFFSTYLINVLCAIVPCEAHHPYPEISHVTSSIKSGREEYPTVWTNSGGLKGYTQTSSEGRPFYAFESIPFGQPPIGQLRFRNPVARSPWKGVKDAMKPSPLCLQVHPIHIFRIIGQEDCLYLNIYTPQLPNQNETKELLPVIFYIHGGSFILGGASEGGGAYFLNNDVVLVSINYRLGPLGFLSTGDSAASGNWGLKDQALALKWTRENIQNFGGDPFQLNLIGYSSGSVSVHHQLIYNEDSARHIKSVASLSATAFVHWAVQPTSYARTLTDRLGRLTKCPVGDSHVLVQCLRSVSPYKLVAEQMNLFDYVTAPPVLFIPTIESVNDTGAFITEMPQQVYDRGGVPPIPWMATTAANEGHLVLYLLKLFGQYRYIKRDFHKYAPAFLNLRYLTTGKNHPSNLNLTATTEKLAQFYFKEIKSTTEATDEMMSDMITDRFFVSTFEKALKIHAKVAPTYSYLVNYKSPSYGLGRNLNVLKEEWGVAHGDDQMYYFNLSTYFPGFRHKDPEYKLSQILINIFLNFITTGSPTFQNKTSGEQLHLWDPVKRSEENIRILNIDKDIQMIPFPAPFRKRALFWESLGLEDTPPTFHSLEENNFIEKKFKSDKNEHENFITI